MEKGNNSIIPKSFQESPIKDEQIQDQSSRSWIFQQNSEPVEADQDLDDEVQDNEVTEGVGEQVRGPETVQSPPNDLAEENDDPQDDLEISTHQIESIQKLIGKQKKII